MMRFLLTSFYCILSLFAHAQIDVMNYRTIDGSSNNLTNTEWGAVGVNLIRLTENGYADSISAIGGVNRPNPRTISNTLFSQETLINDPLNLSDYCWVWGQFMDHDIGITPDATFENATIDVPTGDNWFDPMGMGQAIIPMFRSASDINSGTDTENPRLHPNLITAFIDASMVYGSEQERADWLRTFEGGKLKTSSGNLLPFNTTTGELDAEIDHDAPEMDDATGFSDKFFVAGEARANENVLLTSFHTLFVREHNRLCDELATANPDWTDEELYQYARKIVGGLIQSIAYNEWLPAMGVELEAYTGYKEDVNPGLLNVFTAAAFRLGHTLLNSQILRMNNDGEYLPGELFLKDVFFNPMVVVNSGGIEPFLKGMGTQIQQDMDNKMVNDVRNFLFGPPGMGGLDLAAINIKRGRERGLADFNSIRETFGLAPYTFFQEISANAEIFANLQSLYLDINNIDPWVGFLAEWHMPGALMGPTLMKIMEYQFTALRDGDRFYFENDPVLSEADKSEIRSTLFHDVIMRNTGITLMQEHVFEAMPHELICGSSTSEIAGQITTESGTPVSGVQVNISLDGAMETLSSDTEGTFLLDEISSCTVDSMQVSKIGDYTNGVSTLDLVFIQRHILGVSILDSPYKIIAADVNGSGGVTTFDLVNIRRLVLTIDQEFPNGVPSWRIFPADFEFTDPTAPFADVWPETIYFDMLAEDVVQDYIAIKMGDVNGSADPAEFNSEEVEEREEQEFLALNVQDQTLVSGELYSFAFTAKEIVKIQALQFSLAYKDLEFIGLEENNNLGLKQEHIAVFPEEDLLTLAWNAKNTFFELEEDQTLFSLTFKAKQNGQVAEQLELGAFRTKAMAYTGNEQLPVALAFEDIETELLLVNQNQPNPFEASTSIPFLLPEASWVKLSIFDVSGKTLFEETKAFEKGKNEWTLAGSQIPVEGLLFYRLDSNFGTSTLKMLKSN